MTRAERILDWYRHLIFNIELPDDIQILHPYQEMNDAQWEAMASFYRKYYSDNEPRGLILGINPGRLGAGLTGIPFTDTPALESIGIDLPEVNTTETSADFIWRVVQASGGPDVFFDKWFIGGVSPLGFIRRNEKGNWVNFNYYDDKDVLETLKPFIQEQLVIQSELCDQPSEVVLLGTGQNAKAMKAMNREWSIFQDIQALEHPRYIMQYRRKRIDEYVAKFLQTLHFQ